MYSQLYVKCIQNATRCGEARPVVFVVQVLRAWDATRWGRRVLHVIVSSIRASQVATLTLHHPSAMAEKAHKEEIPLPAQAKAPTASRNVPYLHYLALSCLGFTAGYHLVGSMLGPHVKHQIMENIDGLGRFSGNMTPSAAEKLFLCASSTSLTNLRLTSC
jgi:hypothetical protein